MINGDRINLMPFLTTQLHSVVTNTSRRIAIEDIIIPPSLDQWCCP